MAIIVTLGYQEYLVTDEKAAVNLAKALPYFHELEVEYSAEAKETSYRVKPTTRTSISVIEDSRIIGRRPELTPTTFAEVAEEHAKAKPVPDDEIPY